MIVHMFSVTVRPHVTLMGMLKSHEAFSLTVCNGDANHMGHMVNNVYRQDGQTPGPCILPLHACLLHGQRRQRCCLFRPCCHWICSSLLVQLPWPVMTIAACCSSIIAYALESWGAAQTYQMSLSACKACVNASNAGGWIIHRGWIHLESIKNALAPKLRHNDSFWMAPLLLQVT